MSVSFPSALCSAISAPAGADFTRLRILTQLSKQHPISLTRRRLGADAILKFRKPRRLLSLCCSTMPLEGVATTSLPSESILLYSRAFWVSRSIIAWNVDVEDGACYLYASRDAKLSVTDDEILGYDVKIKLEGGEDGLPQYVRCHPL
nr:pullulanase 1, chloroplastic isoform X1 [Ipomoea batatas]